VNVHDTSSGPATGTAAQSEAVRTSDTLSSPRKPEDQKTPLQHLKKYVWRLTAAYVWLRLIVGVFGGNSLLEVSDSFLFSHLVAGLNWLGFMPGNASNLGLVVKVGWPLIITGFSPWHLTELFIYIYSFPVWFGFYSAFSEELSQTTASSAQQQSKPGLRPAQKQLPVVALFGSGLLGWYVLFGDATKNRPIWAAIVLSGALMAALAYRAFQRAKPTNHADAAPLITIEKMATGIISNVGIQWEKNKIQKRSEVLVVIKLYRWYRSILLRIAAFIRGKRGRDRIYALLVFQYALSLLLLLASAVVFWAFCIKATSPAEFQFSKCLLVSVSHFLPGVTAPAMPSGVPLWAVLGPGFTAWILLGIYVSASTSLLPGKQSAYALRAQVTYSLLRQCIGVVRAYIVRLKSLP